MKAKSYLDPSIATSALWLSDLHLDKKTPPQINRLLDRISDTHAGSIFITGDVSTAHHLIDHLREIPTACYPKPVYVVTGNHDYYGSSVARVDTEIKALCSKVSNLHYLDGRQIIPIGKHICVIGDGGWPDARAGYGLHSYVRSPDHHAIEDFRGLSQQQFMLRMQEMGKDSARRIRQILPLALTRYRHVILLTHVPPYPKAVRYDGAPCDPLHLPHYSNLSAGLAIQGIASSPRFSHRRITILSGHSHSSSITHIETNICARVAHARPGRPGPLEVLRFQ